jgi:hypothetical protein
MFRPLPSALWFPAFVLLAACGGGGGGNAGLTTSTRLSSAGVEFSPTATAADLIVSLTDLASPAPVLLQVVIELPAALTVSQTSPLQAIQSTPTLHGAKVDGHYVVVCGDAQNPEGVPLQEGELFRLRLVTTTPRQVGSHEIALSQLLLAQSDGSKATTEPDPTVVTAIVN